MNLIPRNQLSLYGHHYEFCNFIDLYKNKKLPNKILLSGEKGIGKSTLAYHIINCILSFEEEHFYDEKNFKINPDNKSFKLILNKSNPNCISIDIDDDKKSIDINQIRNLILTLNKSSFNKKNLKERLKQRKLLNRYDKFKISFYNKVQNGFLKLSKKQKNKYQLINSNLDITNNEKLILDKIDRLIK